MLGPHGPVCRPEPPDQNAQLALRGPSPGREDDLLFLMSHNWTDIFHLLVFHVAACAASLAKDVYLCAQFYRLQARRSDKRAAVAQGTFHKRNLEQEQHCAVQKLAGLAFTVSQTPAILAAAAAP